MDYYCKDVYNKKPEQVFEDIKLEIEKNGNPGIALKFLDDFVNWLGIDHPNIILKIKGRKNSKTKKAVRAKTKDNYVIYSRKVISLNCFCSSRKSSHKERCLFLTNQNTR